MWAVLHLTHEGVVETHHTAAPARAVTESLKGRREHRRRKHIAHPILGSLIGARGRSLLLQDNQRFSVSSRDGHVASFQPNHRPDPPRPLGDREIVGRMVRIPKGVGWRDVQPEWCMMVPLGPSRTILASQSPRGRGGRFAWDIAEGLILELGLGVERRRGRDHGHLGR